ncbi:MAG: penicillin-binding protein 1C [Acidobacteriota bacterium]
MRALRCRSLGRALPLARQRIGVQTAAFLSRPRAAALILPAVVGSLLAAFLLLDAWFPLDTSALHRQPATVVRDSKGEALRMFLPPDGRWRFRSRLEEISPLLLKAVVASEDRWFGYHPGVNPLAVMRALWTNLRARQVVSGASTIPMQIARMAEPKPRILQSKVIEAFRALQLVWHLSKRELLEIYLNMAPYGGNLEGVAGASYFYFGKTPSQLSLGEAALLTALPRSPLQYDPFLHPEAALKARNQVLRQLRRLDVFPQSEIDEAWRQPLPRRRQKPPFLAPHFSQMVRDRFPGREQIETTLDARIQRIAEAQVRARIGQLRDQGIENASVVVIENHSRSLRAMVGSAGFFESALQGQVNGATARRSPGSTLKPFLYARAFDQGEVVPQSYLLDIPTDFSGYVAQNYDGQYRGRVTAREALTRSLNASAVRLLARSGLEGFYSLLRRGGLSTLEGPAVEYGLPLVLGACEVTLLDLTNLYATLAQGGLYRPVQLSGNAAPAAQRLLSREAAFWVSRILTGLRRPDLPKAWDRSRSAPTVAWKTGTSYGHRDAWAVGFSQKMSIGVWVGNFDGHGRKGISGAEHATPMLFDLFRAIEEGGARFPRPRGLETATLQLCQLSHQLPGPFCPRRIEVSYLPGRSHFPQCAYHRRIFVDIEEGTLLRGDCLSSRPHRPQVVSVYPPELVAWWRSQGSQVPILPALSQTCRQILGEGAPKIVSPDPSTPYHLRPGAPVEYQKIALVAQSAAATTKLYWYRDGLLMAAGRPGDKVFLSPRQGTHRLVVVDNNGRSDHVTYQVH